MPLDARIAIVTIREKTFRLSIIGSKSKEVWKIIYIWKNDFPQLLHGFLRLRVSQIWQSFSPEVRKMLRIGKKAKFSLYKNFFFRLFPWTSFTVLQILKNFSAIVPKTSKNIRKSWSFQDFLSEMLLWKCSSGHVESSFDNLDKNLPVKIQVFLVKVQKRRKTNCSRVFFEIFPLYT